MENIYIGTHTCMNVCNAYAWYQNLMIQNWKKKNAHVNAFLAKEINEPLLLVVNI